MKHPTRSTFQIPTKRSVKILHMMKFGNFTTSGQSNMTRYVQLINLAECHWLKCLPATVITKKYVEYIPGPQLPLVISGLRHLRKGF